MYGEPPDPEYVIAAVGAVVSTVKSGIVMLPAFPAVSVTVTVSPEYTPADNVLNVIVWLLPVVAFVVVENAKLLVIVPASPVVNT